MGMFDKDKEIGRNLVGVFKYGDEFILWGVTAAGTVPTELGNARKTVLEVSKLDKPREKFDVSTLASAIADKAEQAEPDDFPAVVQLLQVPSKQGSDATVVQFVRPWGSGAGEPPSARPETGSEDIPF